jgi:hypothetical protein
MNAAVTIAATSKALKKSRYRDAFIGAPLLCSDPQATFLNWMFEAGLVSLALQTVRRSCTFSAETL